LTLVVKWKKESGEYPQTPGGLLDLFSDNLFYGLGRRRRGSEDIVLSRAMAKTIIDSTK